MTGEQVKYKQFVIAPFFSNHWFAKIYRVDEPTRLTYSTDWANGSEEEKYARKELNSIIEFAKHKIDEGFTTPRFQNEQHLNRLA